MSTNETTKNTKKGNTFLDNVVKDLRSLHSLAHTLESNIHTLQSTIITECIDTVQSNGEIISDWSDGQLSNVSSHLKDVLYKE